jgi:hypothetical protein
MGRKSKLAINEYKRSVLRVKSWCENQGIREAQYDYWFRIIREESLVQAGTLAITNPICFVELKPEVTDQSNTRSQLCTKIKLYNGMDMDIYNGAYEQTLKSLIRLVDSKC